MGSLRRRIGAGEFKAKCLQLIDEVGAKRFTLTITKRGTPMARLVPCDEPPSSLFGCMSGSVEIRSDIVEGTGERWEVDE